MSDLLEEFPCDICGCDDAESIPSILEYTGNHPIHVCKNCGFVYIRKRRSAEVIADDWSDNLFGSHYTSDIPHVKARQVFVAENLKVELGLKGKFVCDIGAGEGQFLDIVRSPEYGADVFGIEPSAANGKLMRVMGIEHFVGTLEDYSSRQDFLDRRFDVVTMMWTLEGCILPRTMLNAAYDALKDDGHILLATGSRILVPFKKPLHYYIGKTTAPDTHCFRFSANAQRGILAETGFEVTFTNRYIDNDILCMIARKTDKSRPIEWPKDDYMEVLDFFDRWDRETKSHFADS